MDSELEAASLARGHAAGAPPLADLDPGTWGSLRPRQCHCAAADGERGGLSREAAARKSLRR